MGIINGSLDLLKVPTAKVVEKDGKEFLVIDVTGNSKLNHFKREQSDKGDSLYMGVGVCSKREVDDYGKTHYIELNRSKEEREQGSERIYLGDGKEYIFDSDNSQPKNSTPSNSSANSDDLPF